MSFKALTDSVVSTCNNVFGSDFTYTPNAGSPKVIKGVFDNAYIDVEGVVTLKPILRIVLSDLDSAPGKGDVVADESLNNYRVLESRLDGFGGSTLVLQKV